MSKTTYTVRSMRLPDNNRRRFVGLGDLNNITTWKQDHSHRNG